MTYQRTQIYLDPDDHRRLAAEAHARGISLAALLREIVSERLSPRAGATKDFSTLIGLIRTGGSTDAATDLEGTRDAAMVARYEKKMGGEVPPRR